MYAPPAGGAHGPGPLQLLIHKPERSLGSEGVALSHCGVGEGVGSGRGRGHRKRLLAGGWSLSLTSPAGGD